jgi:hypothetical protein
MASPCVICEMQMVGDPRNDPSGGQLYDCRRCGRFILGDRAGAFAEAKLSSNPRLRAITSHIICKMQRGGETPRIDDSLLHKIWAEGELPSPAQQADMLIQLIGEQKPPVGQFEDFTATELAGLIGTGDEGKTSATGGLSFILDHLQNDGLVDNRTSQRPDALGLRLTFAGWRRLEDIQRSTVESTTAFMAMKFGRALTDNLFLNHLKPTVKQAGFELRRLDERPQPGLIDQRIEVELRTAKFVVAELTYGNRGAYWEAGFAHGLGKPVFYLCDGARSRRTGTHFDTNHHFTILWDASNMAKAGEELKTAIRFALPGDAKLTD